MLNVKKALSVALVVGAAGLSLPAASTAAAAMPLAGIDPAVVRDGQAGAQIEQARWVCGPYRCHWAPWGYGPYYGYGYGPGWGGGWRGRGGWGHGGWGHGGRGRR